VLRGGAVLHSLTRPPGAAKPGSLDQDWFLAGSVQAAIKTLPIFVDVVCASGTVVYMMASPVMFTIVVLVVQPNGIPILQKVQIALDVARSMSAVVMSHDLSASQCLFHGIAFYGTNAVLAFRDTGMTVEHVPLQLLLVLVLMLL
jgi:hypothetical protein